jgi:N-acyl-phosphatidylethanolamine-hydrolysing phospholipase D
MKKFKNPYIQDIKKSPLDVLFWKMGLYDSEGMDRLPPPGFSYNPPIKDLNKELPHVQWINHSSFLISLHGKHFLTDPIWNHSCSPSRFFKIPRIHEPGISIESLPAIDYVLISHNHYDHLDEKSVMSLYHHYPLITWIVPLGVKPWFLKRKITNVIELDWWEKSSDSEVSITAVPSQHFSGRNPFNINKSLWCGFVIEAFSKNIYFCGDTGYNQFDFKKIGEKFKKMDLSMIPIGTYCPKRFMQPVHINPYEAVKIHLDVESKFSIGMHWNTFRLSDEPLSRPPYDLVQALKQANLTHEEFIALKLGQSINF